MKQKTKVQNRGLIIDERKPEDWVFGGVLSAPKIVLQPAGQWDEYLPKQEEQTQNGFDPLSCASYGTLNVIEMLIKRQFGDERNYSDRFLAAMTGTKDLRGNSPQTIAQYLKNKGDVYEVDCPFGPDIQTYDDYYAINNVGSLTTKAAAFPAEFALRHEYVNSNPADMMAALKLSPLGVSVYAWPHRDSKGLYYKSPGELDNHWCIVYGYEAGKYWKVFDSAENATKKLRWDYKFAIVKRYHLERQVTRETWWTAFLRWLGLAANTPPEPPKIAQDASNNSTATLPPAHESKREKLHQEVLLWVGKDASPKDHFKDEVGCADSASNILHTLYPDFPAGIGSTAELARQLDKHPGFKRTKIYKPGCPIVSPRTKTVNGHAGFFSDKSRIISNDSKTGLMQDNYSWDSWVKAFKDKKKLDILIWEPL